MILYKNVIITLVTVALFSSGVFVMCLINRCPQFRDDVTFPLLMSIFSAGITQSIFGIMAMITSWFDLQFLLQSSIWTMLVAGYAGYYSLSCISSMKLFAVIKPFVFQRTVTRCKTTVMTASIWITCSCAFLPIMFYPEIVTFRAASQTPVSDFKQEKVQSLVWRFAVPMLYIPNIFSFLSSSGLFIITIKHAIRIQLMKRRPINASNQDDGQGQITRVIMAALWSTKGVMVLSVMRLTIHLPFFLMESRQRDTSNLVFYFQWGLLSGPIFDSICFVGCGKTLRQLIALKYKCGNRIQPLSESGPRQCQRKLTSQMEQAEQGCIQDRKNMEAKHGLCFVSLKSR